MPRQTPLDRLRMICLALPEASEKIAWGEPTFRVDGKMFAMFVGYHHAEPFAVHCKAPPGIQEILVGAAADRFFVPPYVGHKGWIGIRLDLKQVDWDEVATHIAEAYRMTASKRVAARPSRRSQSAKS